MRKPKKFVFLSANQCGLLFSFVGRVFRRKKSVAVLWFVAGLCSSS